MPTQIDLLPIPAIYSIAPMQACVSNAPQSLKYQQPLPHILHHFLHTMATNSIFDPPPKVAAHGTFMRYFVIVTSAILSFIFVIVLSSGSTIWHLRDVFSGREKNNVPKDNNGSEKYRPQQPYPDMKKLKVTRNLRYYAQQLSLDLEEYETTTEDGYILLLHRLIDPNDLEEDRARKPPILLQHGLLSASGAWLAPGRNSLPYYFINQGFDVWMGNNRCEFQPKHATLKGNLMHNEEFWDWDIRVFAVYDLPCIIDNVLARKPHHERLHLVGHSQGCTQTFLMLRNPKMAAHHAKIIHFFALAPAIFPGSLFHDRSFIKFIHNRSPTAYKAIFGKGVFIGFLGWARRHIGTTRLYSTISYQMFKYLFGWNIRNNYNDKKVQHIQFLMNVSYISSKLMSWWLSYSVEEGFLNQLQSKEAYAKGENYAFTPVPTNEDEETEVGVELRNLDISFSRTQEQQDMHVADEKTFFPYKSEWFSFHKNAEKLTPMNIFICGEDYLVDGRRLASHMTHYERRLYKEGQNLIVHDLSTYNHLDVIWAQDCIGTIGIEIAEVVKSEISSESGLLAQNGEKLQGLDESKAPVATNALVTQDARDLDEKVAENGQTLPETPAVPEAIDGPQKLVTAAA